MVSTSDVRSAFFRALDLSDETNIDDLEYRSIPQWDSVAHMSLVAELEDEFDVMFDTDDVIDMSSFRAALDILRKLGVEIS